MDQPKWLHAAWAELGQREVAGSKDNSRILAFYKDAGHPEIVHDETAWCAAFAGACLKRAGLTPSGSLLARSYERWGQNLGAAKTGAIAVLSRGSDPALGHVGFVIGETGTHLILLGGNQSDAVTVAAFPLERLVALRWPAETAPESTANDTLFARCLVHVLEMEGGFDDDRFDPGGPTNKGITLRVYAEWIGETVDATSYGRLKSELRRIDDATVAAIYSERYWVPSHSAELPGALALMHFDAAVNHGVGTAAGFLQTALGVSVDGEIGPLTLAAARTCRVDRVIETYASLRRDRYRSLSHFWRFGRGWLSRVEKTIRAAEPLLLKPSKTGDLTMTMQPTAAQQTSLPPKWWGESTTIWGAAVTALSAIVPAVAALSGISLSPDIIVEASGQASAALQAVMALIGTAITIYGRFNAKQPLERRLLSLKI